MPSRSRAHALVAACAASCLVVLGTGCVYTNLTLPLDRDLDETQLGAKVGRSEAQSVLGLVAWGDAGTQAAAQQAGITTLRHADQEVFSILSFVYVRNRTVVYGD
jgi:hypothetical protein